MKVTEKKKKAGFGHDIKALQCISVISVKSSTTIMTRYIMTYRKHIGVSGLVSPYMTEQLYHK